MRPVYPALRVIRMQDSPMVYHFDKNGSARAFIVGRPGTALCGRADVVLGYGLSVNLKDLMAGTGRTLCFECGQWLAF